MIVQYIPTLACLLNGHARCSYSGVDKCKFDEEPYRPWQFMHCSLCGYVRMALPDGEGNERWEPVDGLSVENNV